MKKTDVIRAHDEEAHLYDQQAREYESHAHDLLFGMSFAYVSSGQRLLDLGIGTGLSSQPFAQIGLEISGADGSTEMLKVCEAKGFARDLKSLNLLETPFPYADRAFAHVVSCGVFHFFDDLEPIFKEASRIVNPGCIFAFTVATPPEDTTEACQKIDTAWDVAIFGHSNGYIVGLLEDHRFEMLKRQKCLMPGGKEGDLLFTVYVARKHDA